MIYVVLFVVFMALALVGSPFAPDQYRSYGYFFLWLAVLFLALHTGLRL